MIALQTVEKTRRPGTGDSSGEGVVRIALYADFAGFACCNYERAATLAVQGTCGHYFGHGLDYLLQRSLFIHFAATSL